MLDRLKQSPEVVKATDQMTAVVRDFLRDESIPAELVEFAICEAMRVLWTERWSSSQVLTYCRKVINHQEGRMRPNRILSRKVWLDDQLPTWLMRCQEGR